MTKFSVFWRDQSYL